MQRFRLKFPKQEIELLPGNTLIGRSSACTVTIEDPLVSREHALVRVDENEAIYEDLASRNGSKINGVLVYMPRKLEHGDVIAIGKHELQFLVVSGISPPANRTTGFMRNCSRCGLPYPAETGACPHCDSSEYIEEAPSTQQFTEPAWALEMLGEMLERAISQGRAGDVQRVVRRVMAHVNEEQQRHGFVDRKKLESLVRTAEAALPEGEAEELWAWAKSLDAKRGS